jgi:hypothetical protein
MAPKHLSPSMRLFYNGASGRFGLASCTARAKRDRNFRRESTDGNEKADSHCDQRCKFARWCAGGSQDAALYRCGERGRKAPDQDQYSPDCSCDRESTNPGNASQRPGWAFTARCDAAESATPADQKPAVWFFLSQVLVFLFTSILGRCITNAGRWVNAQVWQGFALNQKLSANRTLKGGAK